MSPTESQPTEPHKGRTPRRSAEGTKQRIITVRMPAELHSRLVDQREAGGKSLNQFALGALMEALSAALPTVDHTQQPQQPANANQN